MLIFAFLFQISSSQARTRRVELSTCLKNTPQPNVTITFSSDKLRYFHSKNHNRLAALHRKMYGGETTAGTITNGLSTYNLNTHLQFNVGQRQVGDLFCYYPQNINLEITLNEPNIYIAKEIKTGTCSYEVTLRHEQTHQQINIETIRYYMPTFRKRLLEVISQHAVAATTTEVSLTLAKDSLMKHYQPAITSALSELKEILQTGQSKLDNAKQYDYEASLCN